MSVMTYANRRSGNHKTGPMATTFRSQDSCPTTCPLLDNGCYAKGRIFDVSRRYGSDDVSSVLALVDVPLPYGIRFNVSGDFLDGAGKPDKAYIEACNKVADAHPDVPKIAYTHAWRTLKPKMFRFPVNASCETYEEVEEAVAAGWQAVIINGTEGDMIGDKRVVTCLAQTQDEMTCADCKLCASDVRTRPVVSFIAHGTGMKRVTTAVAAKRTS